MTGGRFSKKMRNHDLIKKTRLKMKNRNFKIKEAILLLEEAFSCLKV